MRRAELRAIATGETAAEATQKADRARNNVLTLLSELKSSMKLVTDETSPSRM